MIAIIDYGMGNLRSVSKAFEAIGVRARVSCVKAEIESADRIVLPGVGAMGPAMEKLRALDLTGSIAHVISKGKPFLGICLGLQLLFDQSSESGSCQGLGIIPGTVERFTSLKVPHMGWNQVKAQSVGDRMFRGLASEENFYFCHSYFVKPKQAEIASGITAYGVDFVAAVVYQNVWGVQFHPEKSQRAGLQILRNFSEL